MNVQRVTPTAECVDASNAPEVAAERTVDDVAGATSTAPREDDAGGVLVDGEVDATVVSGARSTNHGRTATFSALANLQRRHGARGRDGTVTERPSLASRSSRCRDTSRARVRTRAPDRSRLRASLLRIPRDMVTLMVGYRNSSGRRAR